MRVRTRWTAGLVAAVMAVTLTACGGSDDDAGNVQTVPPAAPAESPHTDAAPAGHVIPQAAGTRIAQFGETVAVLGSDGSTVTLHETSGAPAPREVKLPVDGLVDLTAIGGAFLAVGPQGLVRIGPDGRFDLRRHAIDSPLSIAQRGGESLVGTATGSILVFSPEGEYQREIGGFVRVDDILVVPDTPETDSTDVSGQVSVLDRAQSAVLPVDIDTGDHKAALRAGNGATNAVVDHYGRISVTGTRDNEIYAFYGQPIVMRLRAPAPASPYAIAYDDTRDVLWVSSTADNVAVAYDLSGGDAVERDRIATVGQVSSMAVDPTDGTLRMVSGRGDGLQVVPADAVKL
ncbi:hypothetical protein [Gordonia zhaorongruii]|uniref:hypothetical protein n=1 Tax=Gordonia zhaorongruii TaxID=2597659 RepID=UPI001048378D|nr:hypothetical protein [Gordonia zhaorongruii]